MEIPVERILTDPHNPRRVKPDDERQQTLEKHLEVTPVIREPLIVQRTSIKDGGTYLLIDGERRYRAACKAGFDTVPCDVYTDLDDEEREILRSIKNFGKEKWTSFDEMSFLTDQYEKWKSRHGYDHGKEQTRRQAFCQKFDVSEDVLKHYMQISSSPSMKQKLKEGWAIDKVLMSEVGASLTPSSEYDREQVSEKIIRTAKIFEEHIPPPSTPTGKIAQKTAKARTQGVDVPTRDTLAMARRTVRAEVQPKVEDKSEIACNNIIDWLDKVAVYNTPIKSNIPLLQTRQHMKQVLDNLQSQIKEYQDFVRSIAKRGNFKV